MYNPRISYQEMNAQNRLNADVRDANERARDASKKVTEIESINCLYGHTKFYDRELVEAKHLKATAIADMEELERIQSKYGDKE